MFDGSICLIISNMEAISVDIKRHVSYHLITENSGTEKKFKGILCFFFTIYVNNPIPHIKTRGYSNSRIQGANYDMEGKARMTGTIIFLQIVLEARQKRHAPNICLQLRDQKEWKK